MIEALGIVAVTTMVLSYALENIHRGFVLVFAAGCALAAVYALLINSYPFVVAEGLWSVIALYRWHKIRVESS